MAGKLLLGRAEDLRKREGGRQDRPGREKGRGSGREEGRGWGKKVGGIGQFKIQENFEKNAGKPMIATSARITIS